MTRKSAKELKRLKVTQCCGAPNRIADNISDITWFDLGICPECRQKCLYIRSDDTILRK